MVDRLKIKLSEERNQLRKEIAALKAENERLAKERQDSAREWRIAFDNMHERAMAAERVLAERAGGVKAKLEAALAKVEYQPGDHPVVPVKHDQFVKDVRPILSALTTEPAAPEGQQGAESLTLSWPSRYRLGVLTQYQTPGNWSAHMFLSDEPILTKWGWDIRHCSWLTKSATGETPQAAIAESIRLAEIEIAKLLAEENATTPEMRAARAGSLRPAKTDAVTQDLLDLLNL